MDNQLESEIYPLIPLRDVVVFPHMVIPLFVGREKSNKALEAAMESGKQIMLVAQRSAAKDDPTESDLYSLGTVAKRGNHEKKKEKIKQVSKK
jgi:ATP-dependent Lon protease